MTGPDDAAPTSTLPLTKEVAERPRGQWTTGLTQHGGALDVGLLGATPPVVTHALAGFGDADARKRTHADALASYVQALARMEAAHGSEHDAHEATQPVARAQ